MRDPSGPVAARLAHVGEARAATSAVVAAELRYGAARKGSARLRAALEAAGTPIGGNDMLIAAHALAEGRVMVTADLREFVRVEGLLVEDWRGDA